MSVEDALARARRVADTILYEGYVLYPYRASAGKNRIRWQFGVLAPRLFSEADGSEHWFARTECVLEADPGAELDVTARFLRVQTRRVEARDDDPAGTFSSVGSLDVDGRFLATWDEAVEESLVLTRLRPDDLGGDGQDARFELPGGSEEELVADASGRTVGRVVRERHPLSVAVRIRTEAAGRRRGDPLTLGVQVENVTPWCRPGAPRDEMLSHALAGVHILLTARHARFVSMVDPPETAKAAVANCRNVRTWPVLVGEEGQRDVVLSLPITLSDYPEVAPESDGDFFDATEIDEMLALRVMTLTEEEKRQARGTDRRAAGIVDRCDSMPPEVLERLHGTVRSLKGAVPGSAPTSWERTQG